MATASEMKLPLIISLCLLYLFKKLITYNKLRNFRGPRISGFSESWHTLAFLSCRCHEWYNYANEKYGPLARVGPNLLMTSSAEVWMQVNATRTPYKRSDWFYHGVRFEPNVDNVFSQTDDKAHERRRKQMAPGYSGKENFELESSIDIHVAQLIHLVHSKYLSTETQTKVMDLALKISFFTLDVISTVGLGKSFGMLLADEDVNDYLKSTAECLWYMNTTIGLGVHKFFQFPFIAYLLGHSSDKSKGMAKMVSTARGYVDERVAQLTDSRSDMLASFRRHGLSHSELRSESLLQIMAGSDTTATALKATMLYLLTHTRVYHKLQNEIDEAVHSGAAPQPPGIVSHNTAKQMQYLQAVTREGLRIWPPATDPLPKEVPAGGDTVTTSDGQKFFLPAGTQVAYSAFAMQHDREVYGDDAKCFRPERWLTEDKEKLAAMIRINELTFGHGKWHCLGQPIAHMEIGKIIFELLRNFDWELVNPEKPWRAVNSIGLFSIDNMWVRVTARGS